MTNESHKLTTILDVQYLHEAQIAQGKLESEGIRSFIMDEHLPITIGTGYIEGFRLQVDSFDVVKAKSILESIRE